MQNEMRDRLIELIMGSSNYICDDTHLTERIADYLIANGVIAPKVKAGQTVWFLSEYYDRPYPIVITHLEIYEKGIRLYGYDGSGWIDADIGKTVFLTREEAEKNLEEMKNNETTH